MADIRTEVRRTTEPDKSIHVCAIHINLATVLMNDLADLFDSFFKNPMRRGVSHHQGAQSLGVDFRPFPQIADIDISLSVTLHRNHLKPGHGR
jgi:hypothetical protein